MGARGPKKMTADQLKARGARPDIVRARQAEERAAQRPLAAVAPSQAHTEGTPGPDWYGPGALQAYRFDLRAG